VGRVGQEASLISHRVLAADRDEFEQGFALLRLLFWATDGKGRSRCAPTIISTYSGAGMDWPLPLASNLISSQRERESRFLAGLLAAQHSLSPVQIVRVLSLLLIPFSISPSSLPS
jgi:hypothetical protein